MTAQLVRLIEYGETPEQTREIHIPQAEFLIGRGTDCDLRVVSSQVSRHHCLIRLAAGDATLVDLGSSNGTFLNGQRLRSQAVLRTGDQLQVGACTFVVDLGDGAASDAATSRDVDPNAITHRPGELPGR